MVDGKPRRLWRNSPSDAILLGICIAQLAGTIALAALTPDGLWPRLGSAILVTAMMTYSLIVVSHLFVHQPWFTDDRLLTEYLAAGGRLLVCGSLGENLGVEARERLLGHASTRAVGSFGFSLGLLDGGPQVVVAEGATDAALTLQAVEQDAALHLIRYDYKPDADRVPALDRLVLDVRLPFEVGEARALSPDGGLRAAVEPAAGRPRAGGAR